MTVKNSNKGRRYTSKEQHQIIEFVDQVNAEKGRGGVTIASKKFGVSNLTISAWLKKEVTLVEHPF